VRFDGEDDRAELENYPLWNRQPTVSEDHLEESMLIDQTCASTL